MIGVGSKVEVAVGPRRGCLAVVARESKRRSNQVRRFWWLEPLTESEPLGYYETGELILVDTTPEGDSPEAAQT